jgi:hypothetical protein
MTARLAKIHSDFPLNGTVQIWNTAACYIASALVTTSEVLQLFHSRPTIRFGENMASFQPGQSVRVNLEGVQVGAVLFHAAVNAAVGNIVRKTSEDPPKYLIKLLFSFRGVSEVEVTEDRISAG